MSWTTAIVNSASIWENSLGKAAMEILRKNVMLLLFQKHFVMP